MKRIPIGLTDEQHARLRRVSSLRRRSVGALVREAVDQVYPDAAGGQAQLREAAREVFGRFHSGVSDASERHDAYLAELDRW